jgi:hypothetical protein
LWPKLNSHCWKDMKLAAAKKPDVAWLNTWVKINQYNSVHQMSNDEQKAHDTLCRKHRYQKSPK